MSHWNWASISDGFQDVCIKIYLGLRLDFLGSRYVYCNWVCNSIHFCDNAPQRYWFTTLTFLGHVMSSITWPINSPYVISHFSIGVPLEPNLSSTIFEIFGPKSHTHATSSSSLFGMHHQYVAPLAANSLHSGLFRASSIASSKVRLCWARSFFRVAIQEV